MTTRELLKMVAIVGLVLILILFAHTEMDFVYAGF